MKKRYIVLYCVIAILVFILAFILIKYKRVKTIDDYVPNDTSTFYEDKIFPSKFSKLEIGYNGENDLLNLYKNIYKLVYVYIPGVNNINTENGIKKYYENNKEKILKDLGISNIEEFTEFYKKIKLNKSELNYKSCEIIEDTIVINDKEITFSMKILYNDNDEIMVDVNFSKSIEGLVKFL